MTLTLAQVEDRSFWETLVPGCSVSGQAPPPATLGELSRHLDDLKREGYVNVPGVLDGAFVERLAGCVRRLHEARIPTPFAYAFADTWLAFAAVGRFIAAALDADYRVMPSFWAWYVAPSDDNAGWPPHRDRMNQVTVERDGAPQTLTVWLPLTDATPLNGCIYVLPMHRDERMARGDHRLIVSELQSIRALPATAGSLLAWNQQLMHWGGRASRLGERARISIGCEFQRGDRPPFREPLLSPTLPSFEKRLGLIGLQLLVYNPAEPQPASDLALARQLVDKYLGG